MTINYFKKLAFLNLIFLSLILFLFFETGMLFCPENLLFSIVLPGFIISFFIKENSLVCHLKLIFSSALFFGFLFALIFVSRISIADSQSQINLIGFSSFFLLFTALNFFGGLAGIIPSGLIERLKTARN